MLYPCATCCRARHAGADPLPTSANASAQCADACRGSSSPPTSCAACSRRPARGCPPTFRHSRRVSRDRWSSCSRKILRSTSNCGCTAAASGLSSGCTSKPANPRRNLRLLEYVADELPFLKEVLGTGLEAEPWDKGWTRVYLTRPLTRLDPDEQADLAAVFAKLIETLEPLRREAIEATADLNP